MKKKYTLRTEVLAARGWQTWTVEAESEEEAIRLHDEGMDELEDEEIEVHELGKPKVIEVEDIE